MVKFSVGWWRSMVVALGALFVVGNLFASPVAAQSGPCWSTPPSMAAGFPQWTTPPNMVINPNESYTATIETNRGAIVVRLLADQAPTTVNNFVCLAMAGYYDVTVFHRIMNGFMIQGGDPTGTGAGGPGYQFIDELPTGEAPYTRGTMAMANAGPNTNGSQFFIVHQDQPGNFPSNYSIFGRVAEGMEVVDAIASVPVLPNERGESSSPVATVGIKSITITDSQGNVLTAIPPVAATPASASPVAEGATPVSAAATAVTTPDSTTTNESTATPVAAPATTGQSGGSNTGLWIAGGLAVVAGGGYWVWNQRRKKTPPAKAKPVAKASTPGTAPTTTAAKPQQPNRQTGSRKKGNRKR